MAGLLSKQSLALPFRDKCDLHTKGPILLSPKRAGPKAGFRIRKLTAVSGAHTPSLVSSCYADRFRQNS